ncbi:transmembrane protein, putative [Medicago truncatula]|uniref:Transmembrane protein, putative n=1 Tax=Medicago truncatula TaxID=3880 RepID=G7KUB0_MEDTR|nr:transmembrane protein, putative [Medicago truncatula]
MVYGNWVLKKVTAPRSGSFLYFSSTMKVTPTLLLLCLIHLDLLCFDYEFRFGRKKNDTKKEDEWEEKE